MLLKWFSHKIVNWAREYDRRDNEAKEDCVPERVRDRFGVDMDHSLKFNVLVCNGGVVLEIRTPDVSTSTSKGYREPITKTYLIPEGEDVAERIGQIVSMEILRV